MKIIRSAWRRGPGGKLIVGLGSLITACIACSCITLAIPSPARPTSTPAPAAQLAAAVTFAPSATTSATSTPAPTEAPTAKPTEAPTSTPEPATATPIPPTATEPPAPTAEPTQPPAEEPTALPTEAPTAEAVAEAPTEAPIEAPAVITSPAEVTPIYSDGVGGANSRVEPAWWPCKEGQIKANNNSDIYHVPGGRDYSKTWKNVTCYNTPEEAEANNFRAAQQ